MGKPIRILDLARELIARNDLQVGVDIDIQFTGIRPGEKLYEELSCENEHIAPTPHAKIHVWQLPAIEPAEIDLTILTLSSFVYSAPAAALSALWAAVPETRPSNIQKKLGSLAA